MQYFKMLHATGGTQAVVNALGNTARENAPRQKAPAAVVVAAVPSTNAPVAPVAPPATVLMIEKSTAFFKQGAIDCGASFGYAWYNINQRAPGQYGHASQMKGQVEVDYFVIDNLSIGLAGNVDWLRGGGNNPGLGDATLTYGELVGRYHVPLFDNRISPYVGLSGGAGYVNVDGKNYGDGSMTSYGAQAGILVPLSDDIAIEGSYKYVRYQLPGGWHTDLDSSQVLLGFRLNL